MRIRLLLAALCLLAQPIWFSPSKGDRLTKSTPFATVALAGHTIPGNWCECGGTDCICGPGELANSSNNPVCDQPEKLSNQGASTVRANSEFDISNVALILGLALFVWARLRV